MYKFKPLVILQQADDQDKTSCYDNKLAYLICVLQERKQSTKGII
jgi:hypothetical protein